MRAKIIDRGRGPEIAGTRITVYDVMDYVQKGWRSDQIAGLFRLPLEDIQVALQYIKDHKEEVLTVYQRILRSAPQQAVLFRCAGETRPKSSKVASQARRGPGTPRLLRSPARVEEEEPSDSERDLPHGVITRTGKRSRISSHLLDKDCDLLNE